MRIAFLTRSLNGGGAERQVCVLASGLAAAGHDVSIVPFYAPGSRDAAPDGARVLAAGKRGRWDVAGFLPRLVRILRTEDPDVLHSYLPMANLLAVLLRPALPRARIVWGLRASTMELGNYDLLSRASFAIERLLARRADLMIANAEAVKRDATRRGYPAARIRVVPNGIDAARFAADPGAGCVLRRSWGVADDAVLVGVVGRLDPMKDHETFLAALALLAPKQPKLQAAIVGDGPAAWRERLAARAAELGVADRLIWAGWQGDMAAVYAAIDLLCLPSAYGEGFPNVVGEAMAAGVPCAVSDVGDAAAIVGDAGKATAPRDPAALAAALDALLALSANERRALGQRARARILAEYGVDRLVTRTLAALQDTLAGNTKDAGTR